MKLLMYGGGNIGRGFIGAIFALAGHEVVFVDINTRLVECFNRVGAYTVQVVAQPAYSFTVQGVSAIDGNDRERVVQEIANCDIMATSLGGGVLARVAPLLAQGFVRRKQQGRGVLDILICENMKDAAQYLRGHIKDNLPPALHASMEAELGLVEAAVGRMVPVLTPQESEKDPLFVKVEEYDFLPLDRNAFRGEIPDVPQIVPYEPFAYYEERKLYLHNMAHCICAYLGLMAGHEYIWQAMQDARIRLIVQGAMQEAAAMLSVQYDVPYHILQQHAEDLQYRFTNKALGDTCARVARDPARKIAANDRLAAPLRRCMAMDIQAVNIAAGLAAVLHAMDLPLDELQSTLSGSCKLSGREAECVHSMLALFKSKVSLEECILEIDQVKRSLRGRTI